MSRKRILCVDDNASILRTLKAILSRHYDVVAADLTYEAVNLFDEAGPFPVLLTDARMPGKSGIQLVREIKSKDPDVIAMVLPADSVSEETKAAVDLGEVFSYLHKPLQIAEMFHQVDKAFDFYETNGANRSCLSVNYQFQNVE